MPKGLLAVQLIGADGLKDTEVFGRSDPYAFVSVGRKPAQRSATAEDHGSRPSWNQTFNFQIDEGDNELHIRIFNENTLSTDDDIGSAIIPLGHVFATGTSGLQSYQVIRPSGRPQGTVRVSLIFTVKDKAPKVHVPQAGYQQAGQGYAPPPGNPAYPLQGAAYIPPGSAYPPPGGSYPPQGRDYPPPHTSYPPAGAPPSSYPAPGGYPHPDQAHSSYPPSAYPGTQPPPSGSYPTKPPKDQYAGAYPAQAPYYEPAPTKGYPQQGYPQQGYPPQGYPPQGYPPQPHGAAPHGYPSQPHGAEPHGYPQHGYGFAPEGHVTDKHKEGKYKEGKEGKYKEGKEGKYKEGKEGKYKEGKEGKDKHKEEKHKYEEGHYGAPHGYATAPYGYPPQHSGSYAPPGYPSGEHYYGGSGHYKEGKLGKEGKKGKGKKGKKKEGLIEGILGMGIF
eukprot:TRINITY_DN12_c0_g1_i5.p1 TRINITY_DN12_c0_g1~~TRINITY_DN12_c0_g1_i5.p1  ORF type:complete len:446 (-),score=79.00 TRINITY_DN12_c0_g1_i5:559-1896(-)